MSSPAPSAAAPAAEAPVFAPGRDKLSVVLMAYNEEASVQAAIEDVRAFCHRYAPSYEIVVVDDGSSDETARRAEAANSGDVVLVRHPSNLGMGAVLRDGYAAATGSYLTALPADRQIRAEQLLPFWPHLGPEVCVHGKYSRSHGGLDRALMSWAFRVLLRQLGQLRVDFDGAYVFHRHWLERIDLGRLRSNSFVFSFELLDAFSRAGCRLIELPMTAFPREVGTSRVARPGRILKVAHEVALSRLRRTLPR